MSVVQAQTGRSAQVFAPANGQVAATLSLKITEGDHLIAVVTGSCAQSSITPPAGWTLANDGTTSATKDQTTVATVGVYWYIVTALDVANDPASRTVTFGVPVGVTSAVLAVFQVTGLLKSANPVDRVSVMTGGAGSINNPTLPAFSSPTSQPRAFVLAAFADPSASTSNNTWTNGFAQQTATLGRLALAAQIVNATGSFGTQNTFVTARVFVGAQVSFKAVPDLAGGWNAIPIH